MLLPHSHDIEPTASHSKLPHGDPCPTLSTVSWTISATAGFVPSNLNLTSGESILFLPWAPGTLTAPMALFGGTAFYINSANNGGAILQVQPKAPNGSYPVCFTPQGGGPGKTGTITIGPGNGDCDGHRDRDR
jgi:hypothetical protein